jgi:hypothetical protein
MLLLERRLSSMASESSRYALKRIPYTNKNL